ncbi:hypothetical protein EC960427_4141A, partial [Escherichia coli 96.0427]
MFNLKLAEYLVLYN